MLKKIINLFLILLICSHVVFSESSPFDNLKQNLIKDGFEREFIEKVYNQSEAEYIPHIITINVKQTGDGSSYLQYYEDSVVEKVRSYISENNEFLIKLYEKYNVPPGIVCSILMIESKLGTYMGKHRVINIYSSMAASNTEESIDDIYKRYQKDAMLTEEQKLSRENVSERVKKKSDWAYSELKLFLKYIKDNNINPYDIKGSFSGAFGLAQFIPSSFYNYAVDGDTDGKVDLYNHYDAMASIANYLKENGWRKDLSSEDEKKVIYSYNRSKYYVDAVINIAAKLKEKSN